MKKISIIIIAVFALASCTKEHSKDYLTLSGKLENNKDSILTITGQQGPVKSITMSLLLAFKGEATQSVRCMILFNTLQYNTSAIMSASNKHDPMLLSPDLWKSWRKCTRWKAATTQRR